MVKVCYSIRKNLGNALNPIIIKQILGYEIEWADEYNCNTSGIGSGLRLFFKSPHLLNNTSLTNNSVAPGQIWSAGFLTTPAKDIQPIRNLYISSVRGELSKSILNSLYGDVWNIKTGDGGLLAGELLKPARYKKYSLGIIPHDRERGEMQYNIIQKNIPKSVIIDVRDSPLDVIKKISQCKCIISSSLHGLIVSDSLGVPNKWVRLTNNLLGDGFKFHDYYSVYNIKADPLDINNLNKVDLDGIIANYAIPYDMVNNKKQEIIDSFKMYL